MLDGAHNVAGARSLAAALADEFPPSPRTLVIGLLREKDPTEMLEAFDAGTAVRLVVCRAPSPRARAPEEIVDAALSLGIEPDRIEVVDDVGDAVHHAIERAGPDEQVVVTGTLYVVGAARSVLTHAG